MKLALLATLTVMSLPVLAETIPLSNLSDRPSSVSVKEMNSRSSTLHRIIFKLNRLNAVNHPTHQQYKVLSERDITFSQSVGEAQLPYKSLVVAGAPDDLEITIDQKQAVEVQLLSAPAQPEDCRCETQKAKAWVSLKESSARDLYKVDYLGKFRGQDLSRVTIYAAETLNGATVFYPELEAQVRSDKALRTIYSEHMNSAYDYLIISPESLVPGLNEFVQYKTQKGLRVKVVTTEAIGNTVDQLSAYFKSEFATAHYKYALIVGTDEVVPTHQVDTSGSSDTPSDYHYFLMDDEDVIPDVQYGRVVASTVNEVERQTKKWIHYQDYSSEASQYLKMIGIASNEGANPSDEEYIREIEKDLNAGFATTSTHFYQDDATSKPSYINEALNSGIGFSVYIGHGSGTSWASTGDYYETEHIEKLKNASVLQPVIIDVACQNGTLKKGYFGETFMNATDSTGAAIGASMYYGGSVNISWHPPAIMAKGIVKKTISQSLKHMGDALLAGHLYLIENYTDMEAIRDNFEWYHLFGDPSSPVYFK